MNTALAGTHLCFAAFLCCLVAPPALAQGSTSQIGREVAIPTHLQDGEEFNISLMQLIEYGKQLFNAKFTIQEGAGRPMSKGTGAPVSDPTSPLVFPRNFDHVSSPEANACSGCHNAPIEFLKSLQVLPSGSRSLVVDEHGHPKPWPPNRALN